MSLRCVDQQWRGCAQFVSCRRLAILRFLRARIDSARNDIFGAQ